jgi:cell wall-associated NlpC family hydrolase
VYVKGAPTGAKTAAAAKKKIHVASTNPTTYPLAQPVQNFDMPPAGAAAGANSAATDQSIGSAPVLSYKSAPVAKLVSPAELTLDESEPNTAVTRAATAPSVNDGTNTDTDATASNASSKRAAKVTYAAPIPSVTSPAATRTAAATPANHSGMHFWNPFYTAPATDWGQRFLQQARALGDMGLEYDEDWRPPGESHTWAMDCSNTARYLYKVTAGIELPRTASDQYYYLHLQGKAWDVPQGPNGFADTNYLRQYLKPGDLLFWENTYRPDRQPPITHVMVFLGTNTQGQWIMAGSQSSRGGEHNRRNGGPDIYVFRPSQPCGGYTTWLGFVHHQGRFCAFGRPLEADRSKLSVAADN